MKLYSHWFIVFFIISFNAFSQSKTLPLPTPLSEAKFHKPKKWRAHVVVYLDVDGIAPSMDIQLLADDVEDLDELKFDDKLKSSSFEPQRTISMKGLGKGAYTLQMKPGVYQVMSVNAPYYNFPFMMDTASDPRWRFRVYPDSVTYIGHVKIYKERGTDSVEAYLLDRFFTDLKEITDVLKTKKNNVELRHGVQTRTVFSYVQEVR